MALFYQHSILNTCYVLNGLRKCKESAFKLYRSAAILVTDIYKVTRGNLEQNFLWLPTAKRTLLETLCTVLSEGKLGFFLTCAAWLLASLGSSSDFAKCDTLAIIQQNQILIQA